MLDYRMAGRFVRAVTEVWVPVVDQGPPYPGQLRIKRVQGTRDNWELTYADDGRAVFRYGSPQKPGMRHIVWLRVGSHEII